VRGRVRVKVLRTLPGLPQTFELLPHLHGSGTTRRAPNRTRTARHSRLPPECPKPKRMRLISAREGCWGKTTRSKSFWIQLLIPVRTSADSCGPARSLPYGRHRRSLFPPDPAGFLPQRRWHRHGSTHLVYPYWPRRSNPRRRRGRPSRERPGRSRRPAPAWPPRTRRVRCPAGGRLPARGPGPEPCRR
jgi:hypothetical protein